MTICRELSRRKYLQIRPKCVILMFKERYSDISAKEIEGPSFQLVVGE